jgi:hypothetical protein
LPLEVTKAVIDVWGGDRVGYRISPNSPFNSMSDSDPVQTFSYLTEQLNKLGLVYLHVVDPISNGTEKLPDHGKLTLLFTEPKGFDADQYPVRARVKVTATFNGIKEPRQLELRVLIKPDIPPPDPVLLDEPLMLKITSREPIKLLHGEDDIHVRLRWDGKDRLLTGKKPEWRIAAKMLADKRPQPDFHFSEPIAGRFSLLISPRPEWQGLATIPLSQRRPARPRSVVCYWPAEGGDAQGARSSSPATVSRAVSCRGNVAGKRRVRLPAVENTTEMLQAFAT